MNPAQAPDWSMPTYLLTIEGVHLVNNGIRVSPGIRLSQTADRPAIRTMMQGDSLELRLRDGARHRTTLVTYSVEVERGADGAMYMCGDPKDAEIKLTLPS